jgi:type IV secretion system protein VirB5
MRRARRVGIVVAAALVVTREAQAQGLPVFDSSSFGQMVLSVKALGDQLTQLRATYEALSGVRGLGSALYNPALRQYLPPDWARVYDGAMAGGYAGISGTLSAIQAAETPRGSVAEQQARILARSRTTAATDKAVGLTAYQSARERLNQIESLMGQINRTRDQKSIQEVQARIAVEQAALQHETTKLQLVAMLQQSEQRLIEQQKTDVAQKILRSSNTGMPPCCSSRPIGP